MIVYLLKVSIIIVIAFLFYKAVLQQESFFTTNRFYLVGCLVLAFILPFVSLPKLVDQQGMLASILQTDFTSEVLRQEAEPLNTTALTEPVITEPATVQQTESSTSVTPGTETVGETTTKQPVQAQKETSISGFGLSGWVFWVLMLYFFGVVIFSLNLLIQVASVLFKVYNSPDKIEDGDCVIVNTTSPQAPCSFFKYIFIYPDDYDFETYEQIIAHEKIHVRLGHSYDFLIAELAVIILWFNPLIWLFKKEIEKNDEYQTDAVLLDEVPVSKDKYQLSLLQIATPHKPLSITTNYNQSLLKQRIMMMNAKRSTMHRYWKYAFMAPLFFGAVLLLNEPATSQNILSATPEAEDAIMQEPYAPGVPDATPAPDAPAVTVPPVTDAGDQQEQTTSGRETVGPLREPIGKPREILGAPRGPIGVPGEIAGTPKKQGINIFRGAEADMSEGYWYSHTENGQYCIEFRGSQNASRWNINRCFNKSQFQKKSADTFVMIKETGTLQLTGKLDDEVSQGKYTFKEDASFKNYLDTKNITSSDKNLMFHLFLSDVDKKYVEFLKKQNDDLTGQRLLEFAIHGITEPVYKNYLDLYQKYSNRKPTMQEVLEAKIHGITQKYVQEVQAMGYKDLSMKKMMEAKIHGVSASYAESLKKAGFDNLPIDKVIEARIHGITPAAIKDLQSLGFGDLSLSKMIELKIHGVNAAYVKELQGAGFKNLTLDQVLEARIHRLSAASIKDLRSLGFKDMDFKDLISAKIHRVDAAYVEDLRKAGFKDISVDKAIEAKIHKINGAFIEQARQKGYNFSSIDKYIALKIHGMAIESLKD
ncbi:M56 family metallopeptidase [Pontibacter cellulosilyticus]|uniref:Peptidase M56 domain-containing protein n=1 Tax=Pontibacter cellulosilyticus TaxID=1720253 RepID=A0A923N4A5_9BACT|nr:M56 family metallopeptidase [Pontibacter cellulosilyticus]MBC5991909.1 hypothetical protein [Pontibacter cellulosilyticus]